MKLLKPLLIVGTAVMLSATSFAVKFSDIDEKYTAYIKAVEELSAKNVISGYPDGTFKPANTVKRSEVAKMLVTAFDLKKQKEVVTPADVEGMWAKEYVEIAMSNDIITGYEDGSFKPEDPVSYAELSTLITKLLKLEVNDNTAGSWYQKYWNAVQEADLLRDIATNDVLPVNNARRDNVALVIYNALNNDKKEEVKPEEKKEETETKEETNTSSVDTNKIYFGTVNTDQLIRGRDTIDVENFNDKTWPLTVKDVDSAPERGSVLFYKLRTNRGVTVLKELKLSELDDAYVVTAVDDDDDVATIEGQPDLDMEEDDYILAGRKILLDKQNYFEITAKKDRDGKISFKSGKQLAREDVVLEENDRIVVEADKKVFIIIKGLK